MDKEAYRALNKWFDTGETEIINLDTEDWERIKDAAARSPWIPPEYMRNDWVSDVVDFLVTSRKK